MTPIGGEPDTDFSPPPDSPQCIASSVDAHTGQLIKDFTIPGLNVREGDTGLRFIYNSTTASPVRFVKVRYYIHDQLVVQPLQTSIKVYSPLLLPDGQPVVGSTEPAITGQAGVGQFHFNPISKQYGLGGMIFSGIYPGGRYVATGYQPVTLESSHHYEGYYSVTPEWGGMPSFAVGGSTGSSAYMTSVQPPEPVSLSHSTEKQLFFVNRRDSIFGVGWSLSGLRRLHLEGNRVVLIEADSSIREFEQGENYDDSKYGVHVESSSHPLISPEKMFVSKIVQAGMVEDWEKDIARFGINLYYPPPGTDQSLVVDLGTERNIYSIGIDFPRFWHLVSVWDYVKISTSVDNQTWQEWSQYGMETLKQLSDLEKDVLDNRIDSPLMTYGPERSVRYIKFNLGYPSTNTTNVGSGIYRVYAIGSEGSYRQVNGESWPQLSYDSTTQQYTLSTYSGEKSLFDADGRLIQQIDRHGRAVTYSYAAGDRLSRIQWPENVMMEFFYDSGGKLQKVVDSTGRETLIQTDSLGHLTGVVYADSRTVEYSYDARGLLTHEKKGDAVMKYEWDEAWPVVKKVTLPDGKERQIAPWFLENLLNGVDSSADSPVNFPQVTDDDGMVSTVTFEDGREQTIRTGKGWQSSLENGVLKETITYADAEWNRYPKKIERYSGGVEETEIYYNTDMQVSRILQYISDDYWYLSDPSDYNSPYVYQNEERRMQQRDLRLQYQDDPALPGFRQLSRVIDWGLDKSYTYDTAEDLVKVRDNILGQDTTYTYDASHNLIKAAYPDMRVNEMVYDSMGLLIEIKNHDGTSTKMTRNSRGEIVSITDEASRTVVIDRDLMGRVIKETSPSGRIVRYEWSDAGCATCSSTGDVQLTKIIDSGNKEWVFNYDIMGNPIEMIYPDGSKLRQEFDQAGRLSKFINKRGQEITFGYDDFGRLVEKATPEGVIYFTYDELDRVTEIEAPDYHYRYRYGVCDIPFQSGSHTLIEETNLKNMLWSQTVVNHWGLPSVRLDSFNWKKAYYYDFHSSGGTPIGATPKTITYHKRGIGNYWQVDYTYTPGPHFQKKTNQYLHYEQGFDYNANLYIKMLRYRQQLGYAGNFPAVDQFFSREASGLIATATGDRAFHASYTQDPEISGVQHTVPQVFDESYTYDPRGNRLTSLASVYTYNDLNQLTESTTHTYQYDADGNLVEEKDKTTTETKRYYYNSGNRLIKYEHYPTDISPADVVATYTYDIYGKRLHKVVNGTVTHFFWEGDNLSLELDVNNQPVRRYLYGMGKDSVEAHIEFSEAPSNPFDYSQQGWYSYIKDQVGTIYKVYSHQQQQVADSRTYDVFGNLITQTGTTPGRLGFQSKYLDPESGLYYFYHRYYHPTNGRFINEDPMGLNGGINLFDFVKNDSLNYLDPFGLKCESVNSELLGIRVKIQKYKKNRIKPRLKLIFKLSIANWKVLASIYGNFECKFICVEKCEGKTKIDTKKITARGIPIFPRREFIFQGPGIPLGKLGALKRIILTWNQSYNDYMEEYFKKEILKQIKDLKVDADKICEKFFRHL